MSGYGGADDETINAQAFIDNHIDLVRSRLPTGDSAMYCLECGDPIPEARRLAWKGVKTCIPCQTELDKIKVKIRVVDYIL